MEECAAQHVPVVICSAYPPECLPAFCKGYATMGKPYILDNLAGALKTADVRVEI